MRLIHENARDIPVTDEAQVIVAGGGPAGAMAAIAAARAGAKTLLVERAGCAGGIWTSGLFSWMLDVTNKDGLLRELMNRIRAKNEGDFGRSGNFLAFPEAVKRERARRLIAIGNKLETAFVSGLVGSEEEVLFETVSEDGLCEGYTGNYVRVRALAKPGEMRRVRITAADGKTAVGEIV